MKKISAKNKTWKKSVKRILIAKLVVMSTPKITLSESLPMLKTGAIKKTDMLLNINEILNLLTLILFPVKARYQNNDGSSNKSKIPIAFRI